MSDSNDTSNNLNLNSLDLNNINMEDIGEELDLPDIRHDEDDDTKELAISIESPITKDLPNQLNTPSLASSSETNDDHDDDIDEEAFSKLLEFQPEVDPDELFSPDDLLPNTLSTKGLLKDDNDDDISISSSLKELSLPSNLPLSTPNSPTANTNIDQESNPMLKSFSESETKINQHSPAYIIQEKNNLLYPFRKNSLTPVTIYNSHSKLSPSRQSESIPGNDQFINANSLRKNENEFSEDHDMLTPNNLLNNTQRISDDQLKISAYARLDFQSFTFYVQTLHVILGRRSENDFSHKVDVNLGPSKSISRRHAQIFYNFGTGRYELSVLGKNGVFIDEQFVEKNHTVPLKHGTKIQIGNIPFQFMLPDQERLGELSDINNKLQNANKNPLDDELPPLLDHDLDLNIDDNHDDLLILSDLESKQVTTKPQSKPSKSTSKASNNNNNDTTKSSMATKKKKAPVKKEAPKEKKPVKEPKKVYSINEIPPEYRTKPLISYSILLTTCIRKYATPKGMSLSEIYNSIRETYPYYKYCRDGWQSSVRHNLSLNKSFRKVSKGGKGWLWGLDEEYIAERERLKKEQMRQAENKAKLAQEKLNEQQRKKAKKSTTPKAARSKTTNTQLNNNTNNNKRQTISQTLAANRSSTKKNSSETDQQRTMKYLQEQLMILTRDRKGLEKQTITNILTQALAMTINQVTKAAKNKGISGNPLTALMDKNPQHLNLILAAAVNAATVKVTEGRLKSLVDLSTVTIPKPAASKPAPAKTQNKTVSNPATSNSNTPPAPANPVSEAKAQDPDSSFDPTSLSRFFQPKNNNIQQPKITVQSMSKNSLPKKRTHEESEEEEESSDSSSSGSDSSSDDDSDSSDDSSEGNSSDSEDGNSDSSDSEDSGNENNDDIEDTSNNEKEKEDIKKENEIVSINETNNELSKDSNKSTLDEKLHAESEALDSTLYPVSGDSDIKKDNDLNLEDITSEKLLTEALGDVGDLENNKSLKDNEVNLDNLNAEEDLFSKLENTDFNHLDEETMGLPNMDSELRELSKDENNEEVPDEEDMIDDSSKMMDTEEKESTTLESEKETDIQLETVEEEGNEQVEDKLNSEEQDKEESTTIGDKENEDKDNSDHEKGVEDLDIGQAFDENIYSNEDKGNDYSDTKSDYIPMELDLDQGLDTSLINEDEKHDEIMVDIGSNINETKSDKEEVNTTLGNDDDIVMKDQEEEELEKTLQN